MKKLDEAWRIIPIIKYYLDILEIIYPLIIVTMYMWFVLNFTHNKTGVPCVVRWLLNEIYDMNVSGGRRTEDYDDKADS